MSKNSGQAFLEQRKAVVLETAEWLKAWALVYSDTAQAIMNELQEKPSGGFTCYLKRSREAHLSHVSPTMSVEPQTMPPLPPDTSV